MGHVRGVGSTMTTNRPTGGGNSKAGLPSTVGKGQFVMVAYNKHTRCCKVKRS